MNAMSRVRSALCALLLPVSIAACQSLGAAQRGSPTTPVPVARLRDDSSAFAMFSGLQDSLRVVIRDDAGWREYWQRIHRPMFPQPPLPSIDFAREMIVLAALGGRPTTGYDIVIQSAERDSAGIRVFVRRQSPARGCVVGSAFTQPVDLAKLAASDLPVRFSERITTTSCGVR